MNRTIIVGWYRQWNPCAHTPFTLGGTPCFSLPFQSPISPPRRRYIASSALARTTHYEQLDIPKSATKQQIKFNYYKLSKLYHPDLSKLERKEAEAKYLAIRQAYDILSNDRKRREYDTSLAAITRRNGLPNQFAHGYEYDNDDDLLRAGHHHRGATHAWDRYHRGQTQTQQRAQAARDSPFTSRPSRSPSSDRTWRQHAGRSSSAGGKRHAEWIDSQEHRVRSESGLLRFIQVFGIFWFLSLFGGWSVHAG